MKIHKVFFKFFCLAFAGIIITNLPICRADDDLGDFFEDSTQEIIPLKIKKQNSDDLDDFFSEDEPSPEPQNTISPESTIQPSKYFINGSISFKAGIRYDYHPDVPTTSKHEGWSDLKTQIDLEFGTKLFDAWDFFISGSAFYNQVYTLKDKDNYTNTFLDEYEKELELEKLFLRGSLTNNLDIKTGRQIVVWGKSDNIRITDVLNPLDLREPGITDIKDLRLPVFMSRFDYYFSNYSVSAFLIHEHRSNKLPVFGSSYYYLPFEMPHETKPSWDIKNTQLAFSLSGTFPGFDISFYLADIFDDIAYLTRDNKRKYQKILMTGVALNKAHGNFLYKCEAAFFEGIKLSRFKQNNILIDNNHEYLRVDTLIGVEYSGFKDTSLSFEASDRWLTDYNNDAKKSGSKKHVVQYALRVTRTFLNEVLELSLLASFYGDKADDGGFARAQGIYDISDSTSLTLGSIFYASGPSNMLKDINENNSVFAKITYSF